MTADEFLGPEPTTQTAGPEKTGPAKRPTADEWLGPTNKERYDEVQARYDAGKATDQEFDAARAAYTKEHGLGERIAHTWNDAKIGSSVWDFIKSVSKGGYALTPMGIKQNAERATSAEIANLQNEADAKLITKAMQDAIASGDVETAKAIAEGRIKTPRAVSRGEEAILKAKNIGKEVVASLVGAVHGGGDVLMAVPAAISKGAEEVALATGADETAAALNRGRRDIVGARESGINTMVEATGGSQEAASGGRLVGGVAVPVSVPGVQAALKAAGTVAKPIGQVVQKGVDLVSPATRKAFEATAALAGEASENLISAGMDTGVAGTAVATGLIAPKVISVPVGTVAAGALTSRNALAGVGKYPRSLKSYVTRGAGGLGGMVGKTYELAGNAYSKIKDALVTPSQMVGDISTAAVGKAEGSLLGDLISGGKQAADDLSTKIDAMKKIRKAEILEGKTHSTVIQSNLENMSARLRSIEAGNKFLGSLDKIGADQLLKDLHGQLGDAITYAIMGAGTGTALASGMTENPIEAGFGPGAMLGAAVSLIGNGVRVKTLPDGSEEIILDHDVVRNGAADLVEAAAKEPAPKSIRDVMSEAIDAQGYYDEVNPNGTTTRYVRTDRGIEGKLLPSEEPTSSAAAEEPVIRKPGVLRIKPGSMTNTKVVEAAEARAADRRAKLKPEPDADTVAALTKLGYDKATAKATALKAQEASELTSAKKSKKVLDDGETADGRVGSDDVPPELGPDQTARAGERGLAMEKTMAEGPFTEKDVEQANKFSFHAITPESLNQSVKEFRSGLMKKAETLGEIPPEIMEKIDSLTDKYISDQKSHLSWSAKNPGMMAAGPAANKAASKYPKMSVTKDVLDKFEQNVNGVKLRRQAELNAQKRAEESARLEKSRTEAKESVKAATKSSVGTTSELMSALKDFSKSAGRTQQKAMSNAALKLIKEKGISPNASTESIQGLYDDIVAGKGYSNHLPNVVNQ